MRKIFTFLVCSVFLIHCQEPKEHSVAQINSTLRKDVGLQIPMSVAQRWVKKYEETNRSSRTQANPIISATALRNTLTPLGEKLGVIFHYGVNQTGNSFIALINVSNDQSILNSHVLNSSNGLTIPFSEVKPALDQYKSENPLGPWSHYFGINIFENILANSDFDYMELVPALNDSNEQQLVLFVWYTIHENGRTSETVVEAYDKSNSCPPYCNTEI